MVALHTSTGDEAADRALRGLIGLCDLVLPGRVRGVYVYGSYADATTVPGSDLDVVVLLQGEAAPEELGLVRAVAEQCALLSPIRLDVKPAAEAPLAHVTASLKLALCVHGDAEALQRLPLEPLAEKWRRTRLYAFHEFFVLRGRAAHLAWPLDYPDPTGPFYGYERFGRLADDQALVPGTRSILNAVTLIATARLARDAGQQAGSPAHSVRLYREHIGDEWAGFVEAVYAACRGEWQYRVPEDAAGQARLRAFGERLLALENAFLEECRAGVLADLLGADSRAALQAAECVKRVAYPGADFRAALRALAASPDAPLARAAQAALRQHVYVEPEE